MKRTILPLLLVCLLGLVPAALTHLLVNRVLHAESVVKGGGKGLMDVWGGGLYAAVQIEVADALGAVEYAFHNFLVVHFAASIVR